MQTLSLVWGILSLIGMFIAFIPFLGWLNWANIPFASVGLIISIIAAVTAKDTRGASIAGIILCAIAIVLGAIRLVVGFGVL